ncbi:hypothetical protein BO78DRAFT_432609 [Aspergillus sclerotiicarbonarius CBS 121057]|uniref:Uncharacterized protein n=1 Tax=Aspergillus sclerotiicarbonarius (strain CBS 121057 / IBT 28362) TaxID=1448318 RepID=A0A319E3J6_ASPSB|nr:hypothetical protein BO78DRAFT_432609 [Aspergillus sclerotiicarbonarius CBS 121057]
MASHEGQGQTLEEQKTWRGPTFWDNLSKTFLTKKALKELNRRNRQIQPSQRLPSQSVPCQSSPDGLFTCTVLYPKSLRQLARHGGPDLSNLRGYRLPREYDSYSISCSQSEFLEAMASSGSTSHSKTTTYSRNFQQHLIDHGIYPPFMRCPDGRAPKKPENLATIMQRLSQDRPSSPQISQAEFEEIQQEYLEGYKEHKVNSILISLFEGDPSDSRCISGFRCTNFVPFTDGNIGSAEPDFLAGARPEQLNSEVCNMLSGQILPSAGYELIVPNFFLEAKDPDPVPRLQACYNGALGARAIHALQFFQQENPVSDNNAYTISATFFHGILGLYAHHCTQPTDGSGPEYFMTLLRAWHLPGDLEICRQGINAYWNARDWAKEQREEFIKAANQKKPKSQNLSTSPTAKEKVGVKKRAASATDALGPVKRARYEK